MAHDLFRKPQPRTTLPAKRWFFTSGADVRGPFTTQEMVRLRDLGEIKRNTPIKRLGWTTWVTSEDVMRAVEERDFTVGMHAPRGKRATRICLVDRSDCAVLIHDQTRLVRARPLDLSRTGMFVAAETQLFDVGADVMVTVKIRGALPAFNVQARVVRVATEPRSPQGYALQFVSVPPALADL